MAKNSERWYIFEAFLVYKTNPGQEKLELLEYSSKLNIDEAAQTLFNELTADCRLSSVRLGRAFNLNNKELNYTKPTLDT